jgi:hypothetical protein
VEDCQVAGYTTLHKFLKHNVSRRNTYLWTAGIRVVNLDGDAGARDGLPAKLKPGQWVTRNLGFNGLGNFFNDFNFVNFFNDGATCQNEREGHDSRGG